MSGVNKYLGKRIKLIHTDDKFTDLKSGDTGTIDDVREVNFLEDDNFTQFWVKWDRGGYLALIKDVDRFKVIE